MSNYLNAGVDPHRSDIGHWTRFTGGPGSIVDTTVSDASVRYLSHHYPPDIDRSSAKMAEIDKGLDQCEAELDSAMSVFNVSALYLGITHYSYCNTRSTRISLYSTPRGKPKRCFRPIVLLRRIYCCKSSPAMKIYAVSFNIKLPENPLQNGSWKLDNEQVIVPHQSFT